MVYFTANGELIGRLENIAKRQYKYQTSQRLQARNGKFNYATGESIIWAKLHNQHSFMQNWTRHYANYTTQLALDYLTLLMDNLSLTTG